MSFPALSRDEVIDHLRARMPELHSRLPVTRAVLFGSYATGRHTAASDVDLLVVHEGEPRADAYAVVRRSLALPRLEPHVYAEREAADLSRVIECMTRDGVPIFGRPHRP